ERAASWIDGFLAGNEPSLAVFLGVDEAAEHDELAIRRWRDAIDLFRSTGTLPPLRRKPTLPLPSEAEPYAPWTSAGGQVWIWKDNHWSVATDRTVDEHGFDPDSICAAREHHEMIEIDPRHVICHDCGLSIEVE